jgi:predicted alpha/beta-fold hydrolase
MHFIYSCLGILYNAQDMLLYYPDQPSSSRLFVDSPSTFGLFYESIYIRSHDGTQLHALLVRQSLSVSAAAPTVVFFHGNAGNIGHRLPNVQAMCWRNHVNVLLVEYRGYGKSQGWPSEQGNVCVAG